MANSRDASPDLDEFSELSVSETVVPVGHWRRNESSLVQVASSSETDRELEIVELQVIKMKLELAVKKVEPETKRIEANVQVELETKRIEANVQVELERTKAQVEVEKTKASVQVEMEKTKRIEAELQVQAMRLEAKIKLAGLCPTSLSSDAVTFLFQGELMPTATQISSRTR
jgi:hypothetical protein